MTTETIKWIYQRLSTPIIILFSFWIVYNVKTISNYEFQTIKFFFEDISNLAIFVFFIFLTLIHTAIEVFHSIHDYFSDTKKLKIIKNLVIFLYLIIFFVILFFTFSFLRP